MRAALEMMVTGRVDPLVSFTDDVEMQGPMGGASGREQLKTQLSDWRDGLSDIEVTVDRMAVDGSAVAVDWHFDGAPHRRGVPDGGHAVRTHRRPRGPASDQ